jgi:hypothetical protein
VFSFFSTLLDIGKAWLDGFNQKQKAKQDLELAELNNKQRLLLDTQSNNHAWEMANLTDKDKWLRRVSFAMFASPFIIAIFAPEHIQYYFEHAIAMVPEWWQKTFMSITGGVWGLSSLKNILPGVVDMFKKE